MLEGFPISNNNLINKHIHFISVKLSERREYLFCIIKRHFMIFNTLWLNLEVVPWNRHGHLHDSSAGQRAGGVGWVRQEAPIVR